jgi:1,4-dihydroxy-2-naphthoyl-CoA hydrolase
MDLTASLHEVFKGLFPDLIGIELIEAAPERIRAALIVRDEISTTGKVLHGGAIMAFADTLGAVGTFVNLPQGARTTTIESKTNFLGAAPLGARILGESTPVHRGRTTMVWQTRITLETGKLVALVTQTQMVLPGGPG